MFNTAGSSLDVTFDLPMNPAFTGNSADFQVRASGSRRITAQARVWQDATTLRLSNWLTTIGQPGSAVWSYNPTGDQLRSVEGALFPALADGPVTVV